MDSLFLALAAAEAEKFNGATSPNPPVGACVVKGGRLLAVGAHERAGTDHAEIVALKRAITAHGSEAVRGATLYVTLEPCNHFGRTPPCAHALLEAEIARVVYRAPDLNPSVKGGGAEALRAAGLSVIEITHECCERLIDGFRKRITQGLPWLIHKQAFRLIDGGVLSMAPDKGQKTFTSRESLKLAHEERRRCDAFITGLGTIESDMPLFNVRHVGDHKGKTRPIAIVTRTGRRAPKAWLDLQESQGQEVLYAASVREALEELGRRGALRVMAEAGPRLSEAIRQDRLWDERLVLLAGESDDQDLVYREYACSRES